jgi:hypothetical protein
LTSRLSSRSWTVRQVAEHVSIGGTGPVIVGSPAVADQLEAWGDETDVDGFNLAFAARPETFANVSDFFVPELQRLGRHKTADRPGLCERNFLARRRGFSRLILARDLDRRRRRRRFCGSAVEGALSTCVLTARHCKRLVSICALSLKVVSSTASRASMKAAANEPGRLAIDSASSAATAK